MSPGATVAVVVAVYNGDRFLAECLDSVLAQERPADEIVVVDDGSTDGTPEILRRYPEVRSVRQDNRGASAARNTALRLLGSDYVAFHDSDDVMKQSRLRVQSEYLDAHPEVGAVIGRQEILVEAGHDAPAWLERDPRFGDLGGVNLIAMMARRELVQRVGGFDEDFREGGEDRDLLVRLRASGAGIAFAEDKVIVRRIHDANVTHQKQLGGGNLLRTLRAHIDRGRGEAGGTPAAAP